MRRENPLRWNRDRDVWLLCVPFQLPQAETVRKTIDFALPRLVDMFRSLPVGERRDGLKYAIDRLKAGAIVQVVVGEKGDGKGDIVLFEATREPERLFSIPGAAS